MTYFNVNVGREDRIVLSPRSHVISNEVIVTEVPFQTIRFSENVFLGIAVVEGEINATQLRMNVIPQAFTGIISLMNALKHHPPVLTSSLNVSTVRVGVSGVVDAKVKYHRQF